MKRHLLFLFLPLRARVSPGPLLVLVAALAFYEVGSVLARSSGRDGYSGNPATNGGNYCSPTCHTGGIVPTVALSGPTSVVSGSTNTYTLTITGGQQIGGGLDVSVTAGTLAVVEAGTQISSGEVTHTAPRSAVGGVVSWNFNWTAPSVVADTTVTMYGAGNSVNLDGNKLGDNANKTTHLITVLAPGQPPIADPSGPYTGAAAYPIPFNGSRSRDQDAGGSITAYNWDFGDASTGTGAIATHAYTTPGTYTVTLTVTDNDGRTNSAQTTATIPQVPSTIGTGNRLPTMGSCATCHDFHGGFQYLLKQDQKDMICRSCHDPDVAAPADLVPTQYQARNHKGDAKTTFYNVPGQPSSGPYEVKCTQCHNPHYYVKNLRGLRGGYLPAGEGADPGAPDQQNCADTAGNTQVCLNRKLFGTIKVDPITGARKGLANDNYPIRILTPGASDTEVNCLNSATNSNPANPGIPVYDSFGAYQGCARITVAGRGTPLTSGGSTYNDFDTVTKPLQGTCNLCHTRTEHHRNNDNEAPDACQPGGNDHTHNVTKRCPNCHAHTAGWSKGQLGSCPST